MTDAVTVIHGNALEVLPTLADESISAIITDPPYNLSATGKTDSDCLRRVLSDVLLPEADNLDPEPLQGDHLAGPRSGVVDLNGEDGPIGIDPRVGMPERPVHLQGAAVGEQEVHDADEPTARSANRSLPDEADLAVIENGGDYVLQLASSCDAPLCDGTCSCFTEPSPGVLAVTVRAVAPTGLPDPGVELGRQGDGPRGVGATDDTLSETQGPASVVAGSRAVDAFVLRLDVRDATGELFAAGRAVLGDPIARVTEAPAVGAGAGARGLPSVLEPYRVSFVAGTASGTFTLHLPRIAHLVDASTTGGFMGREWDGWASPAAYQRWCTAWARECLRVLKPGGHLACFGGTRTFHRVACAIEDAGFEVRDSIGLAAWTYGSGFPKSLDVGKAIDRAAGADREVIGLRNPRCAFYPEPCQGHGDAGRSQSGTTYHRDQAPPATDAAREWEGWGTALKPAWEPIILARKPLVGTVAANVLEHGVGGLNVDACRVVTSVADAKAMERANSPGSGRMKSGGSPIGTFARSNATGALDTTQGRWPANALLVHHPECGPEDAPEVCVVGCPVAELDQQSGVQRDGVAVQRNGGGQRIFNTGEGLTRADAGYGGSGGASRFFPTFRYQAKAPTRERPKIDGKGWPTVKPLALVEWLVRLLTPPHGVVLDPFAGTGTTLQAAQRQGFQAIGIERDEFAYQLAMQRLEGEPLTLGV